MSAEEEVSHSPVGYVERHLYVKEISLYSKYGTYMERTVNMLTSPFLESLICPNTKDRR